MQLSKKQISQILDMFESLRRELYVAASVIELAEQKQKEFHELTAQIAARTKMLEDLNAQIQAGHAELQRQAAERAEVTKMVRELRDEHRRLSADLEQIKKRLAGAEAA